VSHKLKLEDLQEVIAFKHARLTEQAAAKRLMMEKFYGLIKAVDNVRRDAVHQAKLSAKPISVDVSKTATESNITTAELCHFLSV
jgi:hypothetical protein